MQGPRSHARPVSWLRYGVWLLAPPLLWWTFRSVRLDQVLVTLARLRWWQLGALLLANGTLVFLLAARWWVLAAGAGRALTIPLLASYRLMGFGVSYTTPAPTIGGEPLQAYLLHRRQKLPLSTATALVGLDRLVGVTVNFSVLAGCSLLILHWHVFHPLIAARATLVTLALLLALVASLTAFLFRGLPLGWLTRRLPARLARSPALRFVRRTELRAARMLRKGRPRLAAAMILSLLTWAGFFAEFWLMVSFLGQRLSVPQLITAITAQRLSLLLPLPAGIGALEAGQILAFRTLGLDPGVALGAALVIRARDLLLATSGLIWGSWLVGGWSKLRGTAGSPLESRGP